MGAVILFNPDGIDIGIRRGREIVAQGRKAANLCGADGDAVRTELLEGLFRLEEKERVELLRTMSAACAGRYDVFIVGVDAEHIDDTLLAGIITDGAVDVHQLLRGVLGEFCGPLVAFGEQCEIDFFVHVVLLNRTYVVHHV